MNEQKIDQVWLRELGEAEGIDSLLDMQYLCGCCREMCDELVSAPECGGLVCPECADGLIGLC